MSNDFKGSIYDQIRKNRWSTLYLFLMFPLIILGLTYAGIWISIIMSGEVTTSPLEIANEMMTTVGFWVIIGVIGWSFISYFLGYRMVLGFAGAKPIQKKEYPELFRVVENSSIAAGLPKTPDIYIINDMSLNAFATGRSPKTAKVAVSKGLLEKLEKRELEAVMAHEIGHIINRDIRVMLLSITLAGAIEMVGEILIRSGGRNSRNKNPLPLIGILFLTIGVLVGTLTRLAISREREYLADSTSAQLTSNPNALASALEKIAKDARIEKLDHKASMSGLCIADPSEAGHKKQIKALAGYEAAPKKKPSKLVQFWRRSWSTHPPIMERIRRLRGY